MSKEEIKNIKIASEIGGYLKTFTYEEAWANFWESATKEQKDAILNIKQFDPVIFKGITGIDIEKETSLKGKEVEVKLDGKVYKAIIQ